MDLHYKQEISVGIFVIVGIALFAFGLFWLSGRQFDRRNLVEVPVRFSTVKGLRAGDPVQISGVRVGRVGNVVLEDVGRVMVYLTVERSVRPHADARAGVASLDLFGAKFVDYAPGNSPDLLDDNAVITGSREVALTEGATDLTARAGEVLEGLQSLLGPRMADEVHATLAAAQEALTTLRDVGEGPTVRQARSALQSLERASNRLDSVLANPAIGKSVNQLDELTTNVNEMTVGLAHATAALGNIMAKIDSNEGTLGRLVNDTTVYGDLHELSQSLKDLLDDMRERPGRYFNVKVF